MLVMSHATMDPAEELTRALHRRGDPMTARDFLEVLGEAVGASSAPLTAGERDFLISHAGMTPDDLSESGRTATRMVIARDRFALDAAVIEDALSTAEVASLLGRAEANVRRSRLAGDLYAVNPGDPAGLRFPRWQFTESGGVLPGLRRVLPAFPREMHPLAIGRFMQQEADELDGMSPIAWLAGGGSVDPVAALVEDLGYV